tara:strand:- start:274 stop:672 length:399 start_codon:yes stop_codon:yes gene_type:complete
MVTANNTRALRHFGLGMGMLIITVFGLLLPWWTNNEPALSVYVAGSVFMFMALAMPRLLYQPYRLWMVIASILNFTNLRLIMFVLYYCLICPIGIVMKVAGKLSYNKKHADSDSYWLQSEQSPNKNNLKEPF